MSIEVKVGQVWSDRDKRRNTVIEITKLVDNYAQALVVGTEDERSYDIERLVKRWDLIGEKAEAPVKVTQVTYMRKLVSPINPHYFLRMTVGKLEEYGYPRDPWGNQMELVSK